MAAESIIQAFREGKRKKLKHDETYDGKYFYRGNMIAQKDLKTGDIIIDSCRWRTDTTKNRLNMLGNFHIRQKKGVWYISNDGWKTEKEWDGNQIYVNQFLK